MSLPLAYAPNVKILGEHGLHIRTVPGVRAREYVAHGICEPVGKKRRAVIRVVQLLARISNESEPARNSRASNKYTYRDPVPHNPHLISLKFLDPATGLFVRQR